MGSSNLYGHSMSQPLPYDENKIAKDFCLNEVSNPPDDNDIGSFLEINLSYP